MGSLHSDSHSKQISHANSYCTKIFHFVLNVPPILLSSMIHKKLYTTHAINQNDMFWFRSLSVVRMTLWTINAGYCLLHTQTIICSVNQATIPSHPLLLWSPRTSQWTTECVESKSQTTACGFYVSHINSCVTFVHFPWPTRWNCRPQKLCYKLLPLMITTHKTPTLCGH